MSNTKKYVSLDKLSLYDEKIKKFLADADGVALQSAKDYADSLAPNYDAAGAANTALESAKAYADGKDAAIQAAQKAADDAAAAAGVADGKAVQAQSEVDALETYVGTFTHDTAKSVVEYINAKTDGIATSGNLEALGVRVTSVEGDVATIKGDYLKGSDKTELEGKISAVQTAVDTEKGRAEGVEGGLDTRLKAVEADYLKATDKTELQGNIDGVAGRVATIEGDYLKAADKTELQGKIDLKAAQTALDAEVERATKAEAGLQTQIDTIMNNPDAEEAINSINEFAAWVAEHGTVADGMRTDINKNKEDIAAMDTAYKAADTAIVGRLDALEAIDHEAYVAADTALKNELEGDIAEVAAAVEAAKTDASNKDAVVLAEAQKATAAVQTALDEAVDALEGADEELAGRLDVLEGKFTGDASVDSLIATAKQEAIDAAAADATSKANAAEAAAKGHADSLNTAMNTRVDALEAIDHDHSNKAELDLIASGDKAKWDEAYAKRHEHGNKTVLDGITAENVTTWNTVTSKAAQADLTAVGDRVTAIETWHSNFVEVSEEEINGLFA
jgi:hypothetical protein